MGGGGSGVRKRKSHRNGVSRCSRFSCGAHQHTHAQQGCNAPGSAPPRPSAASRPWCAPRACRPRQRPCPCAPEAAEQRRRVSTQTRSGIGLRHKARGITRLFLLPLALLAHATLLLHGRRRVSARGRRVTRKQETRARAPPFLAACPPSWPRGAWRGRPAPRHTPRADRARFRSAGVDFGHRLCRSRRKTSPSARSERLARARRTSAPCAARARPASHPAALGRSLPARFSEVGDLSLGSAARSRLGEAVAMAGPADDPESEPEKKIVPLGTSRFCVRGRDKRNPRRCRFFQSLRPLTRSPRRAQTRTTSRC
jgi:hypothetical protein